MLPPVDLTLWLLTTLVEAFVVYLFVVQRLFRKFLFLNFYLLHGVIISVGRYAILSRFGSSEYLCFYYFTDALLMVFLFLGTCEVSARCVGTKMRRRRVVLLSATAFLAAVWSSVSVASSWDAGGFVDELSRNIVYVCCLGMVLLWAWKLRNNPEDQLAARFVNVLGVAFSLLLLIYRARQMAPHLPGLNNLYWMAGAWLPLGCGFALVSPAQPQGTIRLE